MINPIAPHCPPATPGSPGRKGGPNSSGKPGSDESFDHFLSDDSSTANPPPIDDHSPPLTIPDGPVAADPATGGSALPRPGRWKGSRGPVGDAPLTPAPVTSIQLQSQIDLRSLVPTVGLSPEWSPPAPLPEGDASASAKTGSIQSAPATGSTPGDAVSAFGAGSTPVVYGTNSLANGTLQAVPGNAGPAEGSAEPLSAGTNLDPASDPSGTGQATPLPIGTGLAPASIAPGTDPLTSPAVDAALPTGPAASGVSDAATLPVGAAASSSVAGQAVSTPADTGLQAAPSVADSRLVATATAFTTRAEISASSGKGAAKIADSTPRGLQSSGSSKKIESQTAVQEPVNTDEPNNGTPIAKYEAVVTATLSNNAQETETNPLPKRGGMASPLAATNARTASSHAQGSEVFIGAAVSGVSDVGASASQIAGTPGQEPTAARQVVRVETLLQNALSVGQSIRPEGSSQLEMRVRLDGGDQDVTVRMQVTNDRMQVTFQTNSPELRQALEHGWEKFSADASQSSTLALSEPRFEPAQPNPTATGNQADTASFSSGQQGSRQQEAAGFADEPATSTVSRGMGPAASTVIPAVGPSTGRGWSGWA